MKTIILLFLLLISQSIVHGQTVEWAFTFGSTSADNAKAIAVDTLGNIYATGEFRGKVDFDPGPDTFYLTSLPNTANVFIVKINKFRELVWAGQLGRGTAFDIALDHDGNINVVGTFDLESDFDPGPGINILSSFDGSIDIFIVQVNNNGVFQWARGIGGPGIDVAASMAVDTSNSILTTGYFHHTVDFDPGLNVESLTSAGASDVFIQKMSQAGVELWTRRIGDVLVDVGSAVSVDESGNVVFTGGFHGMVDFDPGSGSHTLISDDSVDVFVSGLTAGGEFLWAKSFGGTFEVISNDILVDPQHNVLLTGYFRGTADFNPDLGHAHLISKGGADIYLSKLSAVGNFIWVKQIGGTGDLDEARAITQDKTGNIYLTGGFQNATDFDPGSGTTLLTSSGSSDMFLAKLNSAGNLIAAHKIGGSAYDIGNDVAVDTDQKAYVAGAFTDQADFDSGRDTLLIQSKGGQDGFIAILNSIPFISDFEGPLAPCSDAVATYSINAENVDQFFWTFPTNWQILGNANNDTVQVVTNSGGGTITVVASGLLGTTIPIFVTVDPVSQPGLSTIAGVFAPCPGETRTYTVTSSDIEIFEWVFPADWQIIGNANNDTVTVIVGVDAGIVSVTGSNACGNITIQRNMNTRRLPVISNIVGNLTPCAGDTITYRAQQTAVTTNNWTLPPGWQLLSNIDTNVITVVVGNNPGSITALGSNICGNTNLTVDVDPIIVPEVNVVVIGNTVAVDQSGQSYQWYINNVSIPGATNAFHIAIQNGSYHAVVTFAGGCIVITDTVFVTITGIHDGDKEKIKVYPVPAQDRLYVDGVGDEFEFVIYDVVGKVVVKGKAVKDGIDVSELIPGIYMLEVLTGKINYVVKVIRE